MKNAFVLVVCGAGTLTSVAAAQGIEEGLQKKDITNVEFKTGRIDDIERYKDKIDVLACSMNVREEYPFPVVNAISFLTGDEEGQQKVIDKIAEALTTIFEEE